MADIRIAPGSSTMSFTSSLNFTETLIQDPSGSVVLRGSGSLNRTNLFAVDGNNGRLFSVDDDLSDSLFSVNTIAGLPVIEAFANNTVKIGQYGRENIIVSGSTTTISGSLGVGTVPGSKLHINGGSADAEVRITTADGYISRLGLYEDTAGTTYGAYMQYRGSTDDFEFGHKRAGTDNSPSFKLSYLGSATFSTDVRAPIFYDSNNTGYYLDPTGGSTLAGASFRTAGNASNAPSTPSANIGVYADTYAFIDLATSNSAGSWIDFSKADGGDYGARIRYVNSSNYLSISANATEQVRVFDTNAEALGSFRAPIFYDSNDTAYYVNPNSTSNLIKIIAGGVGNSTLNTIGGNIGATSVSWNNAQLELRCTDAGSVGIGFHRAGYTATGLWHTGNGLYTEAKFESGASLYAPILYDSNNTGYYVDPASTSNLNEVYAYSYRGNGNVGSTGNAAWFPNGFYSGNGSQCWLYGSLERNGYGTTGGGSAQYSIVYDTNNTGYYVDPASTSNISGMTVAGGGLGVVRSGGTNDPYGALSVSAPSADNYAYIGLTRNGIIGMAMGIDTSSNFWIGTSGGGYGAVRTGTYMTVSTGGTITATADVVAYSDRRVKENIETIENALDKVTKLRGVTYNRTDKEDKSQKIGVIAQEVQEVLPQVVHEQENGMLGVSYGNITAVLIEAIKEQNKEVQDLKNQIEELKQLVNKLINK
jgi:tetrahydromethanopterin S-methyltransferase subunit B